MLLLAYHTCRAAGTTQHQVGRKIGIQLLSASSSDPHLHRLGVLHKRRVTQHKKVGRKIFLYHFAAHHHQPHLFHVIPPLPGGALNQTATVHQSLGVNATQTHHMTNDPTCIIDTTVLPLENGRVGRVGAWFGA